MPLLTFDEQRDLNYVAPLGPPPSYAAAHDVEEERDAPPRKWYHYFPTCVRDPGRVGSVGSRGTVSADADGEEMNLTQALLAVEDEPDFNSPGKWCRKCWAPKPERTHHCSYCGRNENPKLTTRPPLWLARIQMRAIYIASLCISAVYFAFTNPLAIDESTPLHEMSLALAGIVIAMVIGPFFLYHAYLVTTNQTTLEHLSPFLLLRYLPPLQQGTSDRSRLSDPPLEHELSFSQRRLVRDAHGYIKLYDIGWRKNWAQVLGWDRPWGWVARVVIGGGGTLRPLAD
ncbi:hypothetical protein NM688_g1169 [Phlebia brevispora]|uniref:Uncharacterized protein n=1 Tax=Phlebia brevispora TaxID=194682 RepID=A0ACC1TC97_9APHY|nr:hypothetical protein NM688_g1169 [Phlebia brevispora]